MIKAALFDLDGVMVDSDLISSQAYEKVIRQYHKIPVFNEYGLVHVSGMREVDVWEILKKQHHIKESIEILARKRAEFYNHKLKMLLPQAGLIPLLENLQQHNIKLAVASSSSRDRIKTKLSVIHVLDFFQTIISGDDVIHGKPAPDIFLKAANNLEINPSDCVVFEDSQSGVTAAYIAKMKVIAIPTQFTKKHDFSHANLIVKSLQDITWKRISNLA